MEKIGLVLEGGAMRGVYTAGVLDFFLKKELFFPYITAVSAGACQSLSYISGQVSRNKKVAMKYVTDKRYLSFRNFIKTGGVFGLDFMFGDIVKTLVPFDFEAFKNSEQELAIGATNCITGKIDYFYKSESSIKELFQSCIASSSMPLAAKEVFIHGIPYMDGGIAESIPIYQALKDGYEKNIVVLTRNKGYRKRASKAIMLLAKKKYKNYPNFLKAIENRYQIYNNTIDFIENLEKQKKVLIIQPTQPVTVKRMEKNRKKLLEFYKQGYFDTKAKYEEIKKFIEL